VLWLVPGLAFTKYRCEFGTLFCIYAALTLLTLMVTVSGKPNPTNPTYPTNPTTKYRCEFVNLFSILHICQVGIRMVKASKVHDAG